MTASPHVSQILPGVHRVTKRHGGGDVSAFWYAWRGGPQILKVRAASDAALAKAIAQAMPAAIAAFEAARRPQQRGDARFLHGLITRYLVALDETGKLADRTKRDRRKHLDRVRGELGEMETRSLESRRARAFLLDWRDRFAATPKTADELLGALSAVLEWAVDRGDLAQNPLRDFPRIYAVDRAELIWEPQHLATLLAHADAEFSQAVRLAALTGMREGDLIEAPWSAVGDDAIVWQTSKSRRRRTIVVPITPPLRALLAEIPKRATTILASSRKRPWTASGLAAALRRARLAAKAHAEKVHGPDADTGIEGLRFHDLRGTAATNFIRAGLPLEDVAVILGWKLDRVREIARRYVTAQEIGLAMVKRLGGANGKRTKPVNRPVNRAAGAGRKEGIS